MYINSTFLYISLPLSFLHEDGKENTWLSATNFHRQTPTYRIKIDLKHEVPHLIITFFLKSSIEFL